MEQEKICADCGCVIEGEAVEINGELYCPDCAADYVQCANCGEWIRRDDAHETPDGELYCEDCFYDSCGYCDYCGEVCWLDDMIQVARNVYDRRRGEVEYYCAECAENHATQCGDCGEYYTDNITETRDGYRCENCLDEYYYCEQCGEYVHYDEWDGEADMCCRCADECGCHLITAYHAAPSLEYYGECRKQWRGVWRGIGVELEIDRESEDRESETETAENIKDIAGDHVYFNRDGSLDYGFEIITQPHTEEEFWRIDWQAILNACRDGGYTSHDAATCGLHLHISREMFGTNENLQGIAISKLIRFYDVYFADILKISRRTESQANQWAAAYNTHCRKDAETYGKKKNNAGRYHAINNTNRRTVEIRITRGTLNYKTFAACIDFMLTVAKNSRRIAWKNVANVAEWLKGLKPDTIEYIKARGAFLEVL